MNAPADRDDLIPRAPDRRGRGLLLALLMHALLVIGLALGVNWRSSEPDAVEAELWATVPQAAAPAPAPEPPAPPAEPVKPVPEKRVEPPPAPVPDREAEIALERERKLKEQREREEAERRERERKLAEQKKKEEAERRQREEEQRKLAERKQREEQQRKQAEEKRLAAEQEKRLQAQREERLKRLMSEAGTGTGETGLPTGGAAGSPSVGYAAKLRARIRPNIVFTDAAAGNPQAEVEVRAAPDGTILSSRLIKQSGNAEWDQAVMRAIDKTQTLPRDENGRVPSPIVITFRPRDM
ncbi:MAG TPA: cell envelope integrity protein TolA [Burkholderiaceae bacterium]|nr:cell envelope integrity protein TolA [Burkholderiaceae bacterium]